MIDIEKKFYEKQQQIDFSRKLMFFSTTKTEFASERIKLWTRGFFRKFKERLKYLCAKIHDDLSCTSLKKFENRYFNAYIFLIVCRASLYFQSRIATCFMKIYHASHVSECTRFLSEKQFCECWYEVKKIFL